MNTNSDFALIQALNKIIDWFKNLQDKFDKLECIEKKRRLEENVRSLTESLYSFETNKRDLLAKLIKIKNSPNDQQLLDEIEKLAGDLENDIFSIRSRLKDIGNELGENDGNLLEQEIWSALEGKGIYLGKMIELFFGQDNLENCVLGVGDMPFDYQVLDIDSIKQQGDKALEKINEARMSALKFRKLLVDTQSCS